MVCRCTCAASLQSQDAAGFSLCVVLSQYVLLSKPSCARPGARCRACCCRDPRIRLAINDQRTQRCSQRDCSNTGHDAHLSSLLICNMIVDAHTHYTRCTHTLRDAILKGHFDALRFDDEPSVGIPADAHAFVSPCNRQTARMKTAVLTAAHRSRPAADVHTVPHTLHCTALAVRARCLSVATSCCSQFLSPRSPCALYSLC